MLDFLNSPVSWGELLGFVVALVAVALIGCGLVERFQARRSSDDLSEWAVEYARRRNLL